MLQSQKLMSVVVDILLGIHLMISENDFIYIKAAGRICAQFNHREGFKTLSNGLYTRGSDLIKDNKLKEAISYYELSCQYLKEYKLETDENLYKLLSKRYETIGGCFSNLGDDKVYLAKN
jgi:hypothetical protein